MKNTFLLKIAFAAIFIMFGDKVYSQARSNVGFGYGINKPLSGDYESAKGFVLQGTIAINNKIAIVPAIGYERLAADRSSYYGQPYSANNITGSDLIYLGVSAKYHFYNNFFAKAGPILYAAGGNEDLANAGIGGIGALGYNLDLDKHSTLEFSVSTAVVNIPPQTGNGTTSIASFKVAYAFNFRRMN
ncbi:MAG: hypothetical protein JWR50_4174 [Mucilaginibacter sp.]|nr:hypothetical protein [Mucilaginibacter sp.]